MPRRRCGDPLGKTYSSEGEGALHLGYPSYKTGRLAWIKFPSLTTPPWRPRPGVKASSSLAQSTARETVVCRGPSCSSALKLLLGVQ